MKTCFVGAAVALALTSTSLSATPTPAPGDVAGSITADDPQIWLAQGNSGKGNGKVLKKGKGNAGGDNPGSGNAKPGKGNAKSGKGNSQADKSNGKPDHAGGPKPKRNGKDAERASVGNGNDAKGRRSLTTAERDEIVSRIVSTPAPAGRDMARIIGATGLTLASPQLSVSETSEDELVTYSNCPPGLAKKDPPCVPPGLAKKGVTYEEWASYDQNEYDEIWRERRDKWLDSNGDVSPDADLLLLQSDQIETLFDLDPAPDGQRYALIDGAPILLDQEDYDSLLLVNQLAQVPDMTSAGPIAPTAALTQDELINLYRLPQLGPDQNYAVVNGQVLQLDESAYETLQMIRIARAVF